MRVTTLAELLHMQVSVIALSKKRRISVIPTAKESGIRYPIKTKNIYAKEKTDAGVFLKIRVKHSHP